MKSKFVQIKILIYISYYRKICIFNSLDVVVSKVHLKAKSLFKYFERGSHLTLSELCSNDEKDVS